MTFEEIEQHLNETTRGATRLDALLRRQDRLHRVLERAPLAAPDIKLAAELARRGLL
jgi:hypothetical protein